VKTAPDREQRQSRSSVDDRGPIRTDPPAEQSPAEQSAVTRFLDALYIPEKLRHPLSLLPALRSKAGNRTNLTAFAVECAKTKKKVIQWDKVLFIQRRDEEELTIFLGTCMVVSTMLALAFLAGLGVRRALTPEDLAQASTPKVFSMVSKRRNFSEADSSRRPAVIGDSEVRRNDLGQVVEIRAADPRSVLVGYCRAMTAKLCDPIELALSDPPHAQLRFGIYRGLDEMRAIRIRRDPVTGRWVAGDGKREIHDYLARSLRMSGDRLIVEDLD
jgi:hypothetical protein